MEANKKYYRVRYFKELSPDTDLEWISESNTLKGFSKEFSERLYLIEGDVRELIITFLNDQFGDSSWAVIFEESTLQGSFNVKLFQNEGMFDEMKNIIQERLPHIKLRFDYAGTVQDFLKDSEQGDH